MYTPSKYILKGMCAGTGIAFWFIPNIYMATPLEHRSRIPPPLSGVPTDAEYAMDIISRRVACGEEVLPSNLRKKGKKAASILEGSPTKSAYSLVPSSTFQSIDRSITGISTIEDADDGSITETGGDDHSRIGRLKQKMKGAMLPDQSKRHQSLDENGQLLPEESKPLSNPTCSRSLSILQHFLRNIMHKWG